MAAKNTPQPDRRYLNKMLPKKTSLQGCVKVKFNITSLLKCHNCHNTSQLPWCQLFGPEPPYLSSMCHQDGVNNVGQFFECNIEPGSGTNGAIRVVFADCCGIMIGEKEPGKNLTDAHQTAN